MACKKMQALLINANNYIPRLFALSCAAQRGISTAANYRRFGSTRGTAHNKQGFFSLKQLSSQRQTPAKQVFA